MFHQFFVILLTVSIMVGTSALIEAHHGFAPHLSQRIKEPLKRDTDSIEGIKIAIVSVKPNPVRRNDVQNSNVREFHLEFGNIQEKFPKSCCDFSFGVPRKNFTSFLNSENSCPTTENLLEAINSNFRHIEQQNITVRLSVRLADEYGECRDHPYNKMILATTNIVVVDCNAYKSCTECTLLPCRWCVVNHSCLNPEEKDGSYCDVNYTIASSNRDSCPIIASVVPEGSNEIMVSFNESEAVNVSLNTRNIHQFDCLQNFICQFDIGGYRITINAKLASENEVIICDPISLKKPWKYSDTQTSFSVLWNSYRNRKYMPLDNPNNIHVNIYKCEDLAYTCDRCFSLDAKYGCGWCERTDSCDTSHECAAKGPGVWLDGSHSCTNPVIESVVTDSHNQYLPNSSPKGTPAGGTPIDVFGQRLNFVQKPYLYVVYKGSQYPRACEVQNSRHIKCKAPAINATIDHIEKTFPQNLDYGFDMDKFSSGFENMSTKLNNSFMLFPDPVYDPFEDKIRYKSDYLTINGKYLDFVFDESDVTVKIGIGKCEVTSIANKQLTCIPPTEQPPNSLDDNKNATAELPNVTVIVANTLEFYIGKLSYSQPQPQPQPQPKPQPDKPVILTGYVLYVGIGIIILVALCLVLIVFLIAYRCTSRKKTRVLKEVENENNGILEVRVAPECRAAFAERIQTERIDVTETKQQT